jgi:radical SAM protein with 4Fe4S-binding SPASM domain
MEYASSLVGHIALSTNGTLITREFAKRAARIEHVNVQVSIDSPYREHHETLRGKGTYDRTIEGIKILIEENVATALNMVCHRSNLDELEEYYKLALGLGVKRARFIPLQLAGAAIECGLKVPSYKELMEKSLAVFKENPQYKTLTGSDFLSTTAAICRNCAKQGWCGTGLRVMMLNADGTVYPCPNHYLPEFVVGNIREKRFAEMWESSEVLRKIRETYPVESLNEQCAQCPVRHWCVGWCRGETYQVTGSMTAPSVLCEDIRQMIIDMFFNVSLERDVFGDVPKEFGKAQDLKRL